MMAKYFILAVLLVSVAATSACTNTFRGAGRDVERAGEKIQDSTR